MRWFLLALTIHATTAGAVPTTVPGAVISSIRGPYGYVAGPIPKGMAVTVTQVSNRIELLPDFVVVEQTLTLVNGGKRVVFSLGIDQTPVSTGRPGVRTFVPLGASAWLDGSAMDELLVRVRDRSLDDSGGYAIGVRVTLEPGEHVLTLTTALQTVSNTDSGGANHPAGGGLSHLAAELGVTGPGFALDEEGAPPMRTVLFAGRGVPLEGLDAFEWTDGALVHDARVYWNEPVRLGLSYVGDAAVPRAATTDELARLAKDLVARPPHGHFAVPPGTTPFGRPGETVERRSEDAARALRALLVPASALFGIVLVLYIYRRRKERRR